MALGLEAWRRTSAEPHTAQHLCPATGPAQDTGCSQPQILAELGDNNCIEFQGVLVYLSGEPGAPQPVLTQQDLGAAGMQLHPALDLDKLLGRAGLQAGTKGVHEGLEYVLCNCALPLSISVNSCLTPSPV